MALAPRNQPSYDQSLETIELTQRN